MPMPTSLKPLAVRVSEMGSELALKRGELVRMANSTSAATTTDDGFPPGTGGCDCDHCLEGTTIPDGTECCKSHTTWSFKNPWLTCTETDLLLHYAGADTWISDVFDGPDGNDNTYRFVLTIDVDGVDSGSPAYTYLTLVLEDDNGGDDVCIVYGRLGFDCQCDNLLTRKKPFGKVSGIEIADTSCNLCLKPEPLSSDGGRVECVAPDFACDPPSRFVVTVIAGVTNTVGRNCTSAAGCDSFNGTFILDALSIPLGASRCGDERCCWETERFPLSSPIVAGGSSLTYGRYQLAQGGFGGAALYAIAYSADDSDSQTVNAWTKTTFVSACGDAEVIDQSTSVYWGGLYPCCAGWPATASVQALIDSDNPATSTGACGDDDCTPGVTPSNPSGACCYGGYCLDFIDEPLCDDFGGQWFADSGDCDTSCNPTGACCVSGGCFSGTEQVCDIVGGTFIAGGDCDDDPCQLGACCRTDGSCDQSLEADCQGAGEYWNGLGVACGSVNCTVRCCCYNVAGSCNREDISIAECESYLHSETWSGVCGTAPDCGDGAISGTPEPDGDCIFF